MAEQKSGGKNEGNEGGASMQQQQLIALHSINTDYHLLSTDYIPSVGLNMCIISSNLYNNPLIQALLLHPFSEERVCWVTYPKVTWLVSGRAKIGT